MVSESLPKIVFYDLDHKLSPKSRSWSPFTARTALALQHRKLPYTRQPTSYPDIAPFLSSKGVTKPEKGGYTLPAISLHYEDGTEKYIMDSRSIAPVLEELIPASAAHPSLFPDGEKSKELAEAADKASGQGAEEVFGMVVPYIPLILDDGSVPYFLETREKSFKMTMEKLREIHGPATLPPRARKALAPIAKLYVDHAVENASGPFLGGKAEPQYADFINAAMIEWWRCGRGDEVFDEAMEEVDGGVLARVMEALAPMLRQKE